MKRALQLTVSLAISVACLWWTFRQLFDPAEPQALHAPYDAPAGKEAEWERLGLRLAPGPEGLTVSSVRQGSIAARLRLAVGDVLLALDKKPISSLEQLRAALAEGERGLVLVRRQLRNWDVMWESLRAANYLWLLPYLLLLTGIHLCRTLRWGNLLAGLEKVPFRKLNEASGIGFMLLILLPFRLGEFARPFLVAQRSQIRRSAAMTTVVLERIVDGIAIATLLRILLFFVPDELGGIDRLKLGANLMFLVFGGGLAFLLFALWQRERAVQLVRATAGKISASAADRMAEVVDAFVGAMKQLPGPGQLFSFFFFTAGYWVLNGLGMSLFARAFDCAVGGTAVCEPLLLTTFQGFLVLAVLVVGLMIPAAPGGAGTFQAFIILALSVFLPPSVVNSSGLAYANVLWLVQMAQQVAFGLVLALVSKQSLKDIFSKLNSEAPANGGALTAARRASG